MNTFIRQRLRLLPQRNHLILTASVAFLCGCLAFGWLNPGSWLWIIAALGAAAGVLLRLSGASALPAVAVCFFAFGVLRASGAWIAPRPEAGTYMVEATVYGEMKDRGSGRVTCTLTDLSLNGEACPGNAYASIHYQDPMPQLFDGARVSFEGKTYWPDAPSASVHMDFRMWMRQNDLNFGISTYEPVTVSGSPDTAAPADLSSRVLKAFRNAYTKTMGEESSLAMALLFGDKSTLESDDLEAFRTLGIAHIMSVSGLHVGMMGLLLLGLLRRLRSPGWLSLLLLALFLGAYCAVTGMSSAAIRAAAMLCWLQLARMTRHTSDRLAALSSAMLLVLLIRPLQAFSAGFVLSFSAMLGISLIAPPLERLAARILPPDLKAEGGGCGCLLQTFALEGGRKLLSLLVFSIAAQAGVLLPTMIYFHKLPLYGIAINLLIVPLVGSLLCPLLAVTLALSPVPFASRAAGAAAGLLCRLLTALTRFMASWPMASVRTAAPCAALCIAILLAAFMLAGWVPGSFARRLTAAALTVCLGVGSAVYARPASWRYIQLDAGQADSALILDKGTTILIDTGNDASGALDYLLAENRDIDLLILTHLHADHAGGVENLLNAGIRIGQVWLPRGAEEREIDASLADVPDRLRALGIPVLEVQKGDRYTAPATGITVLWPDSEDPRGSIDPNAMSTVCLAEHEGYRFLFSADNESSYEIYAAAKADVLKVAHHGSSSATSSRFLKMVEPSVCVITCKSGSRSLPSGKTLERLNSSGALILRTDSAGDIEFTVRNGRLSAVCGRIREESD